MGKGSEVEFRGGGAGEEDWERHSLIFLVCLEDSVRVEEVQCALCLHRIPGVDVKASA